MFHPEDITAIQSFYQSFEYLNDDDVNMVEYRLQNKGGRWITLYLRGKVFSRNDQGKVDKALIFSEDVTGYHLTKLRFQQTQKQQGDNLLAAAIHAQEVERERISESLHNGLGQLLYGVKLSFNHLFSERVINQPETFEKEKNYTDKLLTNAIDETRRISHELVPKTLKDFGPKAAILDVCQQMGESFKLECSLSGLNKKLNDNLEIALYRIVQELLLNVARHASATMASLTLKVARRKIFIEVKDNGKGFDSNQVSKNGIGLAGINHKIDLLNGKLKIQAAKGGGTAITIDIPTID